MAGRVYPANLCDFGYVGVQAREACVFICEERYVLFVCETVNVCETVCVCV